MKSRPSLEGFAVYHSEEFKSLCRLLGIDHDSHTTDITITVPVEGIVMVAHDYHAESRHIPQDSKERTDEGR